MLEEGLNNIVLKKIDRESLDNFGIAVLYDKDGIPYIMAKDVAENARLDYSATRQSLPFAVTGRGKSILTSQGADYLRNAYQWAELQPHYATKRIGCLILGQDIEDRIERLVQDMA
jgi:hypothetical protein